MGMIANYQQITDKKLKELATSEDVLEDVEKLQEDENIDLCDIDKMWDALHFLLTGKSASDPIEDDLISEAIVGQFDIFVEYDIEEFIYGTPSNRIKEIADALQKVDFEKHLAKFDMDAFSENDIYPDIWGYTHEEDEIKNDLRTSFENLKAFYARMAEKGYAVLISIY